MKIGRKYPRLKGMMVVIEPSEIEEGDRLFYEIGYYTTPPDEKYQEKDWRKTGEFKEIVNVMKFKQGLEEELERQGQKMFEKYCNHHNFMVIKNGK